MYENPIRGLERVYFPIGSLAEKSYCSELANSLEVTVNFSLQLLLVRLTTINSREFRLQYFN